MGYDINHKLQVPADFWEKKEAKSFRPRDYYDLEVTFENPEGPGQHPQFLMHTDHYEYPFDWYTTDGGESFYTSIEGWTEAADYIKDLSEGYEGVFTITSVHPDVRLETYRYEDGEELSEES